jgi:two-component system C4-dicarboxylate transport response regulator DctD
VVELVVPPLRERKEDIPLLFEYFAGLSAAAHKRELRPLSAATVNMLMAQKWRGNVRELRNAAERYALGLGGFAPRAQPEETKLSLADQVEAFERAVIERALAASGGKISSVMEELDIPRRTLGEKMSKLGLDRERFVEGDRQKSANESETIGGKPPKP